MRINGTFSYKPIGAVATDPDTGFVGNVQTTGFVKGCECQIDKSIPAKCIIATDGHKYAYTYDVFIPRHFQGKLTIGCVVEVAHDNGAKDEFAIVGIDDMNPKYIEIWG